MCVGHVSVFDPVGRVNCSFCTHSTFQAAEAHHKQPKTIRRKRIPAVVQEKAIYCILPVWQACCKAPFLNSVPDRGGGGSMSQ